MRLICTSAGGLWLHKDLDRNPETNQKSEERFGKDARQTDRGRGGRQQRRFVHRLTLTLSICSEALPI